MTKCCPFIIEDSKSVIALFQNVFSKAEGEAEGKAIAELVDQLIKVDNTNDVMGFLAKEDDLIIGAIFFSRLTFEEGYNAFLLSPVAVSNDHQRKGIGQSLIRFGIESLKNMGVDLLFTYGDPNYYSQVGYKPITEDVIKAPQPLSMPIGWLCQSLTSNDIPVVQSKPSCVAAFDRQELW